MKNKKISILSLFLIIGLLFIPNAVNAVSTIDEVTINFKEAVPVVGTAPDVEIKGTADIVPVVGRTPQYLSIFSDEYEIVSQAWYDYQDLVNNSSNPNPVSTFEEGKQYIYTLSITHKTAFGWDETSKFNVTNINWINTGYESNIVTGLLTFWRNYKSSRRI